MRPEESPDQLAIVLTCGSFSPVTYMHLLLLENVKCAAQTRGYTVCAGFMSPVHDVYGKTGLLAAEHRLEMLKLSVQDSDWIKISDWECHRDSYSYSYEVVEQLVTQCDQYASAKVLFACGADVLEAMLNPSKWRSENVQRLIDRAILVVVGRCDKNLQSLADRIMHDHPNATIWLIDGVTSNISSSMIRSRIRSGLSIKYMTPDSVIAYIQREKIFMV